jgi:hypothetical protein
MNVKVNLIFVPIIILGAFAAGIASDALNPTPDIVTVEASLYTQETKTLAIIVTAVDRETATRAVESVGGQITADLNEAAGVAATIAAHNLDDLVLQPGLRSIAQDQQTISAQESELSASGS